MTGPYSIAKHSGPVARARGVAFGFGRAAARFEARLARGQPVAAAQPRARMVWAVGRRIDRLDIVLKPPCCLGVPQNSGGQIICKSLICVFDMGFIVTPAAHRLPSSAGGVGHCFSRGGFRGVPGRSSTGSCYSESCQEGGGRAPETLLLLQICSAAQECQTFAEFRPRPAKCRELLQICSNFCNFAPGV